MKQSLTLALVLLALSAFPAHADEPDPAVDSGKVKAELSGYLETRHYGIFGHSTALEDKLTPLLTVLGKSFDDLGFHPSWSYGNTNRIRPTLKLRLGEKASVVVTPEAHSQHGFFGKSGDSVWDYISLERAYLTYTMDVFDFTVGKQVVAFGHGLLLNPTDLFLTRPPGDLRAEQPGVWAAKALFALTDAQNLTFVAALREEACCSPTLIARYDLDHDAFDGSAMVAWRKATEEVVFGLDLKGDVEVGLWAESTFTLNTADTSRWHFTVEGGLDYSFDVLSGWYFAIEWIYRGNGLEGGFGDAPASYLTESLTLDPKNRPQLLGSQYFLFLSRLTIDAKWSLQVLNLLNVRDPSGTVVTQVTWLPKGYLELTLGVNVNYGKTGGEYALTAPDSPMLPADVRGERLSPWVMVTLWGRFYF